MKSSFDQYSQQSFNETASTGSTGGYMFNHAWVAEAKFTKFTEMGDNDGGATYRFEVDDGIGGQKTENREEKYSKTTEGHTTLNRKYVSVGNGWQNDSLETIADSTNSYETTRNTYTWEKYTTTDEASSWVSSTSSWQTDKDEQGESLYSTYVTTNTYETTTRVYSDGEYSNDTTAKSSTLISTEQYNHTFSFTYMTYMLAQGVFDSVVSDFTYGTAPDPLFGTVFPAEGSYLTWNRPVSNQIKSYFKKICYEFAQDETEKLPFGNAVSIETWTNSTRGTGDSLSVPVIGSSGTQIDYENTTSVETYPAFYDNSTGATYTLHGQAMETHTFTMQSTSVASTTAYTSNESTSSIDLGGDVDHSSVLSTSTRQQYLATGFEHTEINDSVITYKNPLTTETANFITNLAEGGFKWSSTESRKITFTVNPPNVPRETWTVTHNFAEHIERPRHQHTSRTTGGQTWEFTNNNFGLTGVMQVPRYAWQSSKGAGVDYAQIGREYDAFHLQATQTLFAEEYGADYGGFPNQNHIHMSSHVKSTRCEAQIPYTTEILTQSESLYTIDGYPYTAYVDYWTQLNETTTLVESSLMDTATASSTTYDGGSWVQGNWSVVPKDRNTGEFLTGLSMANIVVIGVSSVSDQPTSSCYVHGLHSVYESSSNIGTTAHTYWAGNYWSPYTTTMAVTLTNYSYSWTNHGLSSSYLPSTISYEDSYNNTVRSPVAYGQLPYSFMGGRDYKNDYITHFVVPEWVGCEVETATCTDTTQGIVWAPMTLNGTSIFSGDIATYIRPKPEYTKTSIYNSTTFYNTDTRGAGFYAEASIEELSMTSRSCNINYDTIFRPPYETSDYQEGMRIGNSVVSDGELIHYTEYE